MKSSMRQSMSKRKKMAKIDRKWNYDFSFLLDSTNLNLSYHHSVKCIGNKKMRFLILILDLIRKTSMFWSESLYRTIHSKVMKFAADLYISTITLKDIHNTFSALFGKKIIDIII